MTRAITAIGVALALAACGHVSGPDHVTVQTSDIAIAKPCSVDPGKEPAWFDTDAAIAGAANIFDLAKIYAAGRHQHLDWEARLKAANHGCAVAPK